MKKITKHLLLPLLAPILIVCLYFTPKQVFGCANRGLMAVAVTLVALIVAFITAIKAITEKRRGEIQESYCWMLTTLILMTPALLLLGPLG